MSPRFSSFLAVLLLSTVVLFGFPSAVSACSCSAGTESFDAAMLDAPAAAQVGILTIRDGVWVAEVLHDAKGNLPNQVAILAPFDTPGDTSDDAECGVAWREGTVASLVFTLNENRRWLAADACSEVDAAALKEFEVPAGLSITPLALNEPPEAGGWSGWLLVMVVAVVGLYVAKNWSDPNWRNAWFKPNNARNSPARRGDDPTERGHFGR